MNSAGYPAERGPSAAVEDPAVTDLLWDAVVVGAGPAGSVAALRLANHGRAVLLLDRQPFPREKVCGDALIPDALASLRRCGLFDAVKARAHVADTVSIYSPSQIRVDLPGEFLTIRREALDKQILDGAVARGARFHSAEVTRVESHQPGVRVSVKGITQPIEARVAILATGADVSLLAATGMLQRRQPSGIAVRCYVHSPCHINELIVSLDRAILPGYAWIFPLGEDVYNVGAGVFYHARRHRQINLRETLQAFQARFPLARALVDQATEITPLRGAMLRCGLDGAAAFDGGCIVAIGETIGTTFPFTGEGIGKAMETGELAAQQVETALSNGGPEPLAVLPAIIEEELAPRYTGYQVAEAWASRAWLIDLLARRMQRRPALRRAAAGILAETVDPRSVFRWRNLLPRWLR